MTITALIHGKITKQPEVKLSAKGTEYAKFSLLTESDGYITAIAFGELAHTLTKLPHNSSIAARGTLKLANWTNKEGIVQYGLNLTVTDVLTL